MLFQILVFKDGGTYLQFILRHLKKILIFIILIIIFSGITLASVFKERSHIQTKYILSTMITIKAFGNNSKQAVSEAMIRIEQIEDLMSLYKEDSDIWKVNNAIAGAKVKVSEETLEVVNKGLYYGDISNGNFDITIKPLSELWGIGTENQRLPTPNEIEKLLDTVNYKNVELDRDNKTIRLVADNTGIDLGAIAKGYAGDEVIRIMKENGIKRAYGDLGGNIVVLGKKKLGLLDYIKSNFKKEKTYMDQDWRIGIQDPYGVRGSYMAIVKVSDKAIVTSGIYERNFEEGGKIYHHIIDPFTGYPADNGLLSATIICNNSTDADALSTGVFVMGEEKGLKLIESLPSVEAILINNKKEVRITSALKENIKIVDTDFKLID